MRKSVRLGLALFTSLFAVACGADASSDGSRPRAAASGSTISPAAEIAADAGPGDWVRPAKDYASTRFSALAQITASSVKQLGVKTTFSTGIAKGHEAAKLVVNGTMFIVTPFPNDVFALDLTRPGAPLKWKYEPKPLAAAQGVACCDVVNRGASYENGLVVFNTLDNRTIALDAATGAER